MKWSRMERSEMNRRLERNGSKRIEQDWDGVEQREMVWSRVEFNFAFNLAK